MYAFERSSYARVRAAEVARERTRDVEAVLRDARALKSQLVAGVDEEDDDADGAVAAALDARAMREELLTSLDAIECALAEDAEQRKREDASAEEKDAAVNKMQLDAETRDRDPQVVKLVNDAMDALGEAKTAMASPVLSISRTPDTDGVDENAVDEAMERTRRALGRFTQNLERALALEPEYYHISIQLAMFYFTHGAIADAVSHMRRTYEHTPACVAAYTLAGQMYEDIGLFNHAEQCYAQGINTVFDHADYWVSLAKLMCAKFGAVSNAIQLIRTARVGGPEGKWQKPGKHPLALFLLAYMLHLNGYSAEPASLYRQAMNAGVGILSLYPLAKVASDGDDDDAVEQYAGIWRAHVARARGACEDDDTARANHAEYVEAHYGSLEMFNSYTVAPQWFEVLSRKASAYAAIRSHDADGAVAVPDTFTFETIDGIRDDETYIIKGAYSRYAGSFAKSSSRIVHGADARAALEDERARETRGEVIVQRYIRDVVTDECGRKCAIRCHVAFLPNANPALDVAYVCKHVDVYSAATVYRRARACEERAAPSEFLLDVDALTNRGTSGDGNSATVREMQLGDELARVLGVDISEALECQCDCVLVALRERVRASENVIGDVNYTAHATIGAPVFIDLEFLIALGGEGEAEATPMFISVDGQPRFKQTASRAFANDIWSIAFDTIADACEENASTSTPVDVRVVKFG
jgi:tetratricopeptide (TPR) repeat protein